MVELGLAAKPAAWFSASSVSSHSPCVKDFTSPETPMGCVLGHSTERKWGSEKGSEFVT